jgi:hypothetical protein
MGIYTYHVKAVAVFGGRRVGLLAFTGSASFPFWARDIRRNVARARRLSLEAYARDGAPDCAVFAAEFELDPERAQRYVWARNRLSYTDGSKRPPKLA